MAVVVDHMARNLRLLLIGLLGGFVGAEMYHRRKLRRIVRYLEYDGRLMHAAIVVTHKIRGEVDTSRILSTCVDEMARTINVNHCLIEITDPNRGTIVLCSCGSPQHAGKATIAEALRTASQNIALSEIDRYVIGGRQLANQHGSSNGTLPTMGVPIIGRAAHPMGVLLVVSGDCERVWLESEVQLLLSVAHQLSLAVSHARLFAIKEQESLTDPLTNCVKTAWFANTARR